MAADKVLKGEWGFDGQVVSDWGAVYNQVEALKAGNDMDMPGPRGKKVLYQAVENGEISMERLDDAVARMLKLILKTPNSMERNIPASTMNCPERLLTGRRLRESRC